MSIMPTNQDICLETIRSPAAIFIKVPLFETEHRLPAIGQSPTKYREHLPQGSPVSSEVEKTAE